MASDQRQSSSPRGLEQVPILQPFRKSANATLPGSPIGQDGPPDGASSHKPKEHGSSSVFIKKRKLVTRPLKHIHENNTRASKSVDANCPIPRAPDRKRWDKESIPLHSAVRSRNFTQGWIDHSSTRESPSTLKGADDKPGAAAARPKTINVNLHQTLATIVKRDFDKIGVEDEIEAQKCRANIEQKAEQARKRAYAIGEKLRKDREDATQNLASVQRTRVKKGRAQTIRRGKGESEKCQWMAITKSKKTLEVRKFIRFSD